MSRTEGKSVLLAIAEGNISNALRNYLASIGFDVLADEVLHRKYLHESVELKAPDIVVIHDHYLPSNFNISDTNARDQEMLQLIEDWRLLYDQSVRVVYLCVRDRTDPFLGDLVARNVLDIFHEQTIHLSSFNQLLEPPRFSNVKRFGTGNLQIESMLQDEQNESKKIDELADNSELQTENNVAKESRMQDSAKKTKSEPLLNNTKVKERAQQASDSVKQMVSTIKEKLPKRDENTASNNDDLKEFIDLLPLDISEIPVQRATVIGTVLIAVTGVASHLGSTHTSLTIAKYLAKLGHTVAVIELNYSEDFDRIHAEYEGEKQYLKKDDSFDIDGITHYKYREDINLNVLYSAYEYVLLDYGDLEDAAAFTDEIKRAHIRCVVCSADEWKIKWIHNFMAFNQLELTDCVLVVPNCGKEKLEDLRGRLDYRDIFAMPTLDYPYEITKEAESTVKDVLGDFIKNSSTSVFSKRALITTGALSACITTLVFTIIKYFS